MIDGRDIIIRALLQRVRELEAGVSLKISLTHGQACPVCGGKGVMTGPTWNRFDEDGWVTVGYKAVLRDEREEERASRYIAELDPRTVPRVEYTKEPVKEARFCMRFDPGLTVAMLDGRWETVQDPSEHAPHLRYEWRFQAWRDPNGTAEKVDGYVFPGGFR